MLKGSDEPTSASSKKNLSCQADTLKISMANISDIQRVLQESRASWHEFFFYVLHGKWLTTAMSANEKKCKSCENVKSHLLAQMAMSTTSYIII